jgi:hypothetical protein
MLAASCRASASPEKEASAAHDRLPRRACIWRTSSQRLAAPFHACDGALRPRVRRLNQQAAAFAWEHARNHGAAGTAAWALKWKRRRRKVLLRRRWRDSSQPAASTSMSPGRAVACWSVGSCCCRGRATCRGWAPESEM